MNAGRLAYLMAYGILDSNLAEYAVRGVGPKSVSGTFFENIKNPAQRID